MLIIMSSLPDERRIAWERATEWPLTCLALCYLAAYAVPIMSPHLPEQGRHIASAVMWFAWAGFAIDYLVRLALARHRWRFVRQHLLDALVITLPLLRPLRLLRLVTVLRMLNRHATTGFPGQVAGYVGGSVLLLAFVASLAELEAERQNPQANITSFSDAAWWTVTTMTTVGYGDRYPTTTEGRLVAVGLMLAGIALLGVVTATVAAWFVQRVQHIEATESRAQHELAEVLAEVRALRREIRSEKSRTPD
jgi:voltage-gated potassium channel